jgi:hypothetical protein
LNVKLVGASRNQKVKKKTRCCYKKMVILKQRKGRSSAQETGSKDRGRDRIVRHKKVRIMRFCGSWLDTA